LNSVVLPAPLGPMTPTMPPGGNLKERSSINSRSPKPLETPSVMTYGSRTLSFTLLVLF